MLADRIEITEDLGGHDWNAVQCVQVLHADCAASFVSLCDSNMNHLYFINL